MTKPVRTTIWFRLGEASGMFLRTPVTKKCLLGLYSRAVAMKYIAINKYISIIIITMFMYFKIEI